MQNYRWKPFGTLPIGLQHLESNNAAQRYMGYTAIGMLRCAAQNTLERGYWGPDKKKVLRDIKKDDDKELFDKK
jgi:hypothetical protein